LRQLRDSIELAERVHLGAGTNAIYVDPENDLVMVARWIERGAVDGLVQRLLAAINARD
jgi:hypothetical protein